ncbi:Myelin protein zero-like protein 3 [Merluccius polli]|uniref:Myelin protein zero-like protein 3 n=1 Tax=Merluccius polli TaxID=89951 RepID=A0AA47P6C6_MERPO|nr:Myelin protein zero-like protein 3 [Merluccius polli]
MAGLRQRITPAVNAILRLWLLVCFVPSPLSSITVSSPAELHASKGESVILSCMFTSTSRPTSRMSVDWSYRPPSGGAPQTVSECAATCTNHHQSYLIPGLENEIIFQSFRSERNRYI